METTDLTHVPGPEDPKVPTDSADHSEEVAPVSVRIDREPRKLEETAQDIVFDVRDLAVSYGDVVAVHKVTLPIYRNEITALIGPSGCGKTTFLRCLNRMNDLIESARVQGSLLYHGVDLYDRPSTRSRCAGASDGVPEAEPVPQVDLRQHRLRPEDRRFKGDMDELVEESLRRAALWDEVKDKLKESGPRALGRAAAAPVHRPGDRDPSRRDPDGRAVLGAGPDRHAADRGPDAGAALRLHDRDRHAQHAAGRAGLGPNGVLHGRGARGRRSPDRHDRRVRPDRDDLHEPERPRTEDYVTGRFG
jgi:hypothetical protein